MNIAIASNLTNGIGLQREYELLRDFLKELGHEVTGLQFDEPSFEDAQTFDLMISLETVSRHLMHLAPIHFLFINPEWTKRADVEFIRRSFTKVFCKTHEAERIARQFFPYQTQYVGFLVRDQFDPWVDREAKFLHIGGNSSFRGTQEVLDAWKWRKHGKSVGAELIIVSKALQDRPEIPNVTYHEYLSDDEIRKLQNQCKFHIYPSGTEGFGHAIREGLSVNASILTVNAPPMNEIKSAYTVPATGKGFYNLADVYEVSALDIHAAATEILEMERAGFAQRESREEFLRGNELFKASFAQHIENLTSGDPVAVSNHKKEGKMRVAFLGNFAAAESTENMILWALTEGLGYEVECLQENQTTLGDIRRTEATCDLFLWVRTPGWLAISDEHMMEWLKVTPIKTASIHLDKFWGIPDREKLIGAHPFWHTDCVFTADGGFQKEFKDRGVNHYWMLPAVSEVYVHPGVPREKYLCDVGFVGAYDYHAEYPFRRKMVDFLKARYGARFKHIEGVRGHELNDVYASMSIVVGDCIFAGTPNYWSDRLPETTGRHGFLVHPYVTGLNVMGLPGLLTYAPQDLDSLAEVIEKNLPQEEFRRGMVQLNAEHVRKHHTWTVRMAEIIKTIGL